MFEWRPQLKDLLVRTLDAYTSLFEPENHLLLPILKMELTFDDQKMQFYPPVEDLEETILFVLNQICKTMQQVRESNHIVLIAKKIDELLKTYCLLLLWNLLYFQLIVFLLAFSQY